MIELTHIRRSGYTSRGLLHLISNQPQLRTSTATGYIYFLSIIKYWSRLKSS